jgi:hypothetical protein
MTALLKRLAAIEAGMRAATPFDFDRWTDSNSGVWDADRGLDGQTLHVSGHTWRFIQHAPADFAYLLRIVRMAAEAECERLGPAGQSLCARHLDGDDPELWSEDPDVVCWPCRIRKAGEQA